MDFLLPLARPWGNQENAHGITYRDYVETIRRALVSNWDLFRKALEKRSAGTGAPIERVEIMSEKHGSDYHPARIRAVTDNEVFSFVMNVALTERGTERLPREFSTLRYLARRLSHQFFPEVYFMCSQSCAVSGEGPQTATMFLGEWLEGYHEFHLSRRDETGLVGVVLWDTDHGYDFVSEPEAEAIFKQAAFILTCCYDVRTFHEIFPWHHASGDFVVGRPAGNIDVKLISARQYAPRLHFRTDSQENLMNALLLFFANLSVRMRLDRIDGVGEVSWAGAYCVEATVRGFLDGLRTKAAQGECGETLPEAFCENVRAMGPAELAQIFRFVVDAFHEDSPDLPVIRDHLPDHVLEVYRVFHAAIP